MTKYQSLLVHAKRTRKSVSQVYAELTKADKPVEKPAEKKAEPAKKPVEAKPAVAEPKVTDNKNAKADDKGDYKGMSNS